MGQESKGILSGIVSAFSPIASSLIGAFTGSRENRMQRNASMELAKYQYQRDLEMWNRANEYNSPQEQMKRLEAAGLNPNLVYGNGAVGNSSGQLPKFNAPNLQFGIPNPAEGLPNTISMFQDFQIKQQQLDNLRAQEEAIKTSNAIKGFQAKNADTFYREQANIITQKRMAGIYSGDTAAEKLDQLKLKNEQTRSLWPYQLSFMQGKNRAQMIEAEKNLAATAKIKQDTELNKLKTDWFVTTLIGKFGLDVAKTVIGATGVGKLGKMAGQINQNRRKTPRYNSAESWRQMGY